MLFRSGKIDRIEGLDELAEDKRVVANVQRLKEGDEVKKEWIGNEKQVFTRIYLVCESKEELAETLKHYQNTVKVFDDEGNDMLLRGFEVDKALGLSL